MHGFPAWSAHRTSGLAGPEGACFKYVKLSHMPAPAPRNLRPAAYTAGAYCTIGVCSGSSSATRVTWEPTHQLPGADLGPREPAERSPRGSRQVVRPIGPGAGAVASNSPSGWLATVRCARGAAATRSGTLRPSDRAPHLFRRLRRPLLDRSAESGRSGVLGPVAMQLFHRMLSIVDLPMTW
jgi:hypothetical protein